MLVVLIILFLTFGVCLVSKKTFGSALSFSLMIIPIILFLSQMIFETFKVGLYLIYGLAVIGFGITIYKIIKRDKNFLKNIFSKGFFAFIIIVVLIFIIDYHKHFWEFDEIAHWGEMVREMTRIDKFYSVKESLLVWHKDYPPFLSLFELLWCSVLKYSEETVSIAFHVYMFGIICPYLVDKINKKINILFLPLIIMLVILMLDPYQIFKSIQRDLILAVMGATTLAFIVSENPQIVWGFRLALAVS